LLYGKRLVKASRDETRASQILKSEVEDLRAYDWMTLVALDGEANYVPQSSFTDTYSTCYTVKRIISMRSATQRRVTMQVAWTDNGGLSHSREYITLIAKNGLYD
jgi:hypothetical protein